MNWGSLGSTGLAHVVSGYFILFYFFRQSMSCFLCLMPIIYDIELKRTHVCLPHQQDLSVLGQAMNLLEKVLQVIRVDTGGNA
jgi:hypothetical protein